MEVINGDMLSSEINTGSPIINGAVASRFVFDVETTGIDETFTLPLESIGIYDFVISWGDGNGDRITAYNDAAVTHTYAICGTYTIGIRGIIEGWRFNNTGDCTKVRDIKNWRLLMLGSSDKHFYGCSGMDISATDTVGLKGTITLHGVFANCTSLTYIDMSGWNTSSVTSFNSAFYDCDNLTSIDISGMDTSNITMFDYAFNGCISLATVTGIGSLDVTSLNSATSMFHSVTLMTANYDSLLIGWERQAVNPNVTFHGGNSKYSAGAAATARASLVANGWTITDGGQV